MNKTKQKLDSLFDLSIIVEKIKFLEEQQSALLHLTKRPKYELPKQSNTQQLIPHLIDDFEIKRKFKEIQNDSFFQWKPAIIPKNQNKSLQRPQLPYKVNPSPQRLECLIKTKVQSDTIKVTHEKRIRTQSTKQRRQIRKIEANDIEAQFLETRNLINRFNRIKRKEVRFNILT
ncbi:unnamed protein product [Paramecium sonneborni]|uniref:Uncharacterized protein n=1 Tax=Paramecium sonneborni TaxID=65129 RepID=A0A8S1KJ94_9CILI|nr:unnamed protein product [Paramecium sonneborni]